MIDGDGDGDARVRTRVPVCWLVDGDGDAEAGVFTRPRIQAGLRSTAFGVRKHGGLLMRRLEFTVLAGVELVPGSPAGDYHIVSKRGSRVVRTAARRLTQSDGSEPQQLKFDETLSLVCTLFLQARKLTTFHLYFEDPSMTSEPLASASLDLSRCAASAEPTALFELALLTKRGVRVGALMLTIACTTLRLDHALDQPYADGGCSNHAVGENGLGDFSDDESSGTTGSPFDGFVTASSAASTASTLGVGLSAGSRSAARVSGALAAAGDRLRMASGGMRRGSGGSGPSATGENGGLPLCSPAAETEGGGGGGGARGGPGAAALPPLPPPLGSEPSAEGDVQGGGLGAASSAWLELCAEELASELRESEMELAVTGAALLDSRARVEALGARAAEIDALRAAAEERAATVELAAVRARAECARALEQLQAAAAREQARASAAPAEPLPLQLQRARVELAAERTRAEGLAEEVARARGAAHGADARCARVHATLSARCERLRAALDEARAVGASEVERALRERALFARRCQSLEEETIHLLSVQAGLNGALFDAHARAQAEEARHAALVARLRAEQAAAAAGARAATEGHSAGEAAALADARAAEGAALAEAASAREVASNQVALLAAQASALRERAAAADARAHQANRRADAEAGRAAEARRALEHTRGLLAASASREQASEGELAVLHDLLAECQEEGAAERARADSLAAALEKERARRAAAGAYEGAGLLGGALLGGSGGGDGDGDSVALGSAGTLALGLARADARLADERARAIDARCARAEAEAEAAAARMVDMAVAADGATARARRAEAEANECRGRLEKLGGERALEGLSAVRRCVRAPARAAGWRGSPFSLRTLATCRPHPFRASRRNGTASQPNTRDRLAGCLRSLSALDAPGGPPLSPAAIPHVTRALRASLCQAELERDAARAELAAAREAARRSRRQRQALAEQLTAAEAQLASAQSERAAGEEAIAAAFSEVVRELQRQVLVLSEQLASGEAAQPARGVARALSTRSGARGSQQRASGLAAGISPEGEPAGLAGLESAASLGGAGGGAGGLAARLRWRPSR